MDDKYLSDINKLKEIESVAVELITQLDRLARIIDALSDQVIKTKRLAEVEIGRLGLENLQLRSAMKQKNGYIIIEKNNKRGVEE